MSGFTSWSLRLSVWSRTCTGRRCCSGCWGRRTSAGWSTRGGGWSPRSSRDCPRCSRRGRCSGNQTAYEKRYKEMQSTYRVGRYPRQAYRSLCVDFENLFALFRFRVASSKRLLLPRELWRYMSPQARPQRARTNSDSTECILTSLFWCTPSVSSDSPSK